MIHAPHRLSETPDNMPHTGDRVGRFVRPDQAGTVRAVVMPDEQSGQPMWAYVDWDDVGCAIRRQRPADLFLLPIAVRRHGSPLVAVAVVAAAIVLAAALVFVLLVSGALGPRNASGAYPLRASVPTPFVVPHGSSSPASVACAPNTCLPR